MLRFYFVFALAFFACAGQRVGGMGGRESPPCDDCRSGVEPNFDVKINRAYREQASEVLALDSGAVIGVLPTLHVIANSPEKCNYCHSFSESAVEFDFAAKEDSVLAAWFPNNERVLLFPGSQVPQRDSAEFWNAFASLREIPLNENKELKVFLKKLSLRYKVRYLAFASFIEVTIKDRKTFEWESEWSLWDAQKGELLLWDYQNITAKSKNSAPVDRSWSACLRL
ncbi:MAG: hypothetical protein LBU89_12055 [Fibromonadaceae bacterium]|nr:hypothetical protein [Fibromonadaceae bacterium]